MDKETSGKIFGRLRVNTRKEEFRFCQQIGEMGRENQPICVSLSSEEENRSILANSRKLRGSRFENVTVVPYLTKMQRKGRREVGERSRKKKLKTIWRRQIKWIEMASL